MKKSRLLEIIDEEIQNVKIGNISEEITESDEDIIRKMIRTEISAVFFDLFKKRKSWGA